MAIAIQPSETASRRTNRRNRGRASSGRVASMAVRVGSPAWASGAIASRATA